MNQASPNPISTIANGYRSSQVLFTAVRLGVFDALDKKPMNAVHLAKAVGADKRAIRMLADALVALGLLLKKRQTYANSRLAQTFLIQRSSVSQTPLILHNACLYERWACLYHTVKTGKPAPPNVPDLPVQMDASHFARAMEASAITQAPETIEKIDLRGVQTMLDIGGGPAIYAIAFARRWPSLHVTVVDCPEAIAVANANIRKAQLEHRIRTLAGDAFKLDLGGPYQFIFISNVVHQYPPELNRRLIARAAAVLAPRGKIAVKDFILNSGRKGPVGASLFAINMLVNTPKGDCYTIEQIRSWMRRAGLTPTGTIRLADPSRVVIGRKR